MAEQVRGSWPARLSLGSLLGAGFWRVLREQRRIAPRLVHAHWWFPAGVVATATSRLSGVPFVTTMHGSDVRLARSTAGAATGLRWVMRASRVTTTVSRWLADEAHVMTPDLPSPRVSPMPAATELFTPGGTRERDRLLFVGRLNAQKGIELLLRALGAMRARAYLDVVGDGPDAAIHARARLLVRHRRPRHAGTAALSQTALPELYRRASALVVPSRDEGLGLVAVEAQLCETPVIAFDSGGLRDIVEHGVTGVLVNVFSADALARAADELLAKPDRAASLGAAGRRAAVAVFSPDAVARSYEAIYRTALAPPRSGVIARAAWTRYAARVLQAAHRHHRARLRRSRAPKAVVERPRSTSDSCTRTGSGSVSPACSFSPPTPCSSRCGARSSADGAHASDSGLRRASGRSPTSAGTCPARSFRSEPWA